MSPNGDLLCKAATVLIRRGSDKKKPRQGRPPVGVSSRIGSGTCTHSLGVEHARCCWREHLLQSPLQLVPCHRHSIPLLIKFGQLEINKQAATGLTRCLQAVSQVSGIETKSRVLNCCYCLIKFQLSISCFIFFEIIDVNERHL